MKHLFVTAAALMAVTNAMAMDDMDHHDHTAHMNHNMQGGHVHGMPAPSHIMGDHVMPKGKFMLGLSHMRMEMSGMRDGTNGVDIGGVTANYMVSPLSMTTDTTMLSGMAGVNDAITIGVMVPYVQKEMDHQRRNGTRFKRDSEGVGDVKVIAHAKVVEGDYGTYVIGLGVSLPTGSIDERDPTGNRLAYPMQIGSGTYDVLPSLTATGKVGKVGLGAQLAATIRTAENDNGYTLGNEYKASFWGSKKVADVGTGGINVVASVNGMHRENIDGSDSTLNTAMMPGADPNLQMRSSVDVGLELNYVSESKNKAFIQLRQPIYQNLKGPQLEMDWMVSAGVRFAF